VKKQKTLVVVLSPRNSLYALRDEDKGEISLRKHGPTDTILEGLSPFEEHVPPNVSLVTVD